MKAQKKILVYADWLELGGSRLMGTLTVSPGRGKEIFSFEYEKNWLTLGFAQQLDPDLSLYSGPQYLSEGKENFGIFLDSSPDRWGRVLMRRREAALSRLENRTEKRLLESDYLLGVYDGHRMGAIRFKDRAEGEFLNANQSFATPPWSSLRELEEVSLKLEHDDAQEDPEYIRWLEILIAPGSSLGGARPKASVVDENQNLYIAKFPSQKDQKDVGAWEMVAHDLAVAAGIKMSTGSIRKFSSRYHTYLTKRFDRSAGGRLHFASAMTLLGYTDGDKAQEGVSYLDIANFLTTSGASPDRDLEELWRRIVFSISISNTDDHLRNHGFILTPMGWELSPAYDLNPVEIASGLSLNISETDNSLDYDLALEVADLFRVPPTKAKAIVQETRKVAADWRQIAKGFGISNPEIDLMSQAFRP